MTFIIKLLNNTPQIISKLNLKKSSLSRVGVNSAPELDFLANSKSNSGIGIELELALLSPGGIGIEWETFKARFT